MRAEGHLESMIGRIAYKTSLIGVHKEEALIAIRETSTEPFVDALLTGKPAVFVRGGFEGIVRRSNIIGERRSFDLGFIPLMQAKRICQLLAVNADFPRKLPVRCNAPLAVFRNRLHIGSGKSGKRKRPVMIELNETVAQCGGAF